MRKRLALCLLVLTLSCSGCTITELSFSYARNLACEKLNDQAFLAAQKASLQTLVGVGFDAGVAAAKEALQCPTK